MPDKDIQTKPQFLNYRILFLFLLLFAQQALHSQNAPKILFLTGEGFNTSEFWIPYFTLTGAGYEVDVASYLTDVIPAGARNREMDYHNPIDMATIHTEHYIALVIPGGYSPANLEKHPRALEIVEDFMSRSMPVGAICHGPRLLAAAGLLSNRVTTGLVNMKDELPRLWSDGAFGQYSDREVVVDNNLITSRYPMDSSPFSRALLKQYAEKGYLSIPKTHPKILVVDAGFSRLHRWAFLEAGLANNGAEVVRVNADDLDPGKLYGLDYVVVAGENITPALSQKVSSHWKDSHMIVSSTDHHIIRENLRTILVHAHQQTERVTTLQQDTVEAIILIRSLFDEEVFIQARNYLEGTGINYRVVSDRTGWITGMNGHKALSESTWQELQELPPDVMLILPGGFWTREAYGEEEEQNAAYILWALEKWKQGARVFTFGTDSWRFAHRDEFAGKPVAASDMFRWNFRNTARFVEEGVVNTAPGLITAKGPAYFFPAIQHALNSQ